MQVLRGRGFRHRSADAFARPPEEEEAAYAIALSARNFSRRTQSLVDDKLSFSATLMRAGEVAEAGKAMAEFERDVCSEKAALLEQVGELGAVRRLQRRRGARPLLARLLATALLGMSMVGGSVAAAAVAGFVADAFSQTPARAEPAMPKLVDATQAQWLSGSRVRTVKLAPGVKLVLDHHQLRTYRQLISGAPVEASRLEAFFEGLSPDLAAAVKRVLATTGVLTQDQVEIIDLLLNGARAARDDVKAKGAQSADASGEQSASESEEVDAEDDSSPDSAETHDEKGSGGDDGGGTEASLPDLLPISLP